MAELAARRRGGVPAPHEPGLPAARAERREARGRVAHCRVSAFSARASERPAIDDVSPTRDARSCEMAQEHRDAYLPCRHGM